ncbi:tRNA uridine-5-carboxymethylaminomethyl(34) synthesis GTPase MnmE [Rhodobacter sp. KR11]|uniref:tRNA uridine-5-carboxymethylaminomethyl(34) synthesis GTPase MnmE n=1 Tax=Rhodobacter sp. KR11 TaxID=2974588 RepID=UPI00222134E1|nr:tRNA uridine-5-carboxymethylaminomethyl(34) synthesis GTPase MnmE [Rhodobacter sp. KR11]MCW1918900.1 tRNA uridine-5-carboxymethylaminomethyl(34) synthesis GTPase MnmE [Rhodobacter sp. KR11]
MGDTIFALASARGKAGVAVFRVSGPIAVASVGRLCAVPERMGLRRLVWGEVLDEALVLRFAAGASFTGEEVVELQVHGSLAVIRVVSEALLAVGLRPAEAGEFTRRALENGRLDLARVEGLADLVDAETEAQRRQALRVFSGAIGARAEGWRAKLIRAAALIEATIDFADEDVPVDVTPEVLELIETLQAELRAEIAGSVVAERVRDGFEVAIIGAPNVGKSTLLNALAGREAAITSEVAGTTRDVIEVRMDLGGLAVTLLDTAGLRETEDRVEAIGVARALKRAEQADLRVFLLSAPDEELMMAPLAGDVVVLGKGDLRGDGVSGLTGQGVDELVARVRAELEARAAGAGVMTRARHRYAMVAAVEALEIAANRVRVAGAELVAEELRQAGRALDVLVGRVDVENLLDEIFSSFCIGK